MPKEVADDVPIMASEGEFVVPADVVRFLGLEKLEGLVNLEPAFRDYRKAMPQGGGLGEAAAAHENLRERVCVPVCACLMIV
jgi:hypothetical protein